MKWSKPIKDYLSKARGLSLALLSYVIRKPKVTLLLLLQAVGKPHSIEFGSTEEDIVYMVSYSHPWCKSNNKKVYFVIEEAMQGNSHVTTIKPF